MATSLGTRDKKSVNVELNIVPFIDVMSCLTADKTEIEIAANSTAERPISYQELIAAMDVAVKAGFVDVGITEPASLSARPVL